MAAPLAGTTPSSSTMTMRTHSTTPFSRWGRGDAWWGGGYNVMAGLARRQRRHGWAHWLRQVHSIGALLVPVALGAGTCLTAAWPQDGGDDDAAAGGDEDGAAAKQPGKAGAKAQGKAQAKGGGARAAKQVEKAAAAKKVCSAVFVFGVIGVPLAALAGTGWQLRVSSRGSSVRQLLGMGSSLPAHARLLHRELPGGRAGAAGHGRLSAASAGPAGRPAGGGGGRAGGRRGRGRRRRQQADEPQAAEEAEGGGKAAEPAGGERR